jgi:hypothetical protein
MSAKAPQRFELQSSFPSEPKEQQTWWYDFRAALQDAIEQLRTDSAGPDNERVKNGKRQFLNPQTKKWHTLIVSGVPPVLSLDPNGE